MKHSIDWNIERLFWNKIIKALHYSGKVVQNSQLHLGVFFDGKCGGALQFGPSRDKRKMLRLVKGTLRNEFLELNRMALADWLSRNWESRVIGQAMRFIKINYPHIKWVVSFADGTQCGDGTIYRASGFYLTNVGKNITVGYSEKLKAVVAKHGVVKDKQGEVKLLPGFQLRYIYFLHLEEKENLTVPILPFSKIKEMGASTYKGEKYPEGVTGSTSSFQPEGVGSSPSPGLGK